MEQKRQQLMKRILIVDDELDSNMTLKLVLEDNGFKVDSLNDALLALDNCKPDLYDLLILDIKMPKMNGFELYKQIRRNVTIV